MNIYGLIAMNTVNIDANVEVLPMKAILMDNSTNAPVQTIEVPEASLVNLLTSVTFESVPPGTYKAAVYRRTVFGDLAGPYVTSNPVVLLSGSLGLASVKVESNQGASTESKATVAPQKQITVPANFVLVPLPQ